MSVFVCNGPAGCGACSAPCRFDTTVYWGGPLRVSCIAGFDDPVWEREAD